MLQSMLADRFKLKFHWENKESEGLALVVAKNGLKLKEASGEEELPHLVYQPGRPLTEILIKGKSTLKRLADYYMPFIPGIGGGPVVDKTGLTGMYEYSLNLHQSFVPGGERGGGGGGDYDPPISTAMEQQLGLRLEPTKVSVRAIVIDEVQKPSEN
jgi:uncharacterized protein (TIGR03435 family)